MREIFEEIAKEENAKCEIVRAKKGFGVYVNETTYDLHLPCNQTEVHFHNRIGGTATGFVEMILPIQSRHSEFEIITKSPFIALFSRNKERVKYNVKDDRLLDFFKSSNELQDIQEIIKKTAFEPHIVGKNKGDDFVVRTEYHLSFEQRGTVIRPLINLYKAIADKIG